MLLQTGTKYREDGTVLFKESCQIFSVEDVGKGISKGQLSFSKKPFGKKDEALIEAGYKLDRGGYIRGNLFVVFGGKAYEKSLKLNNGAVVTDVLFDNDIYPYVNKDGNIAYKNNVSWLIIDFKVKNTEPNKTKEDNKENPFGY